VQHFYSHSYKKSHGTHAHTWRKSAAFPCDFKSTRPEFKAIVLSTQDFTVDFYFRQQWYDERLRFNDSQELCISNEMLGRIWWPDTFFTNAKLARFHDATTKNAFLRIQPSGLILQSLRYTRRTISLRSTAEKNTDRLIASTSQQGREIVR